MSNSRSSFEQKYKLTSLYIPENVYTFKHVKSTTHLHVKQSWILFLYGRTNGRQAAVGQVFALQDCPGRGLTALHLPIRYH